MANQIGLVNAFNELCDRQVTFIQRDSFIPVFRRKENDNIVEKLLVDNLPYGGSSSTIKNVIIINPDEDEVVGKVYHSFEAAYQYMSSINTTERFCVELPSGDFNEDVILNEQWMIHGNNTTITGIVKSNLTVNYSSDGEIDFVEAGRLFSLSKVLIKDCTIANGFEGVSISSGMPSSLNVYLIDNCIVKRFSQDDVEVQTAYAFMKFRNCRIDEREIEYNENEVLAIIMFMNCEIMKLNSKLLDGILFSKCTINHIVQNVVNKFQCVYCEFEYLENMEGDVIIETFGSVDLINCSGLNYAKFYMKSDSSGESNIDLNLYNCYFRDISMDGGTIKANPLTTIGRLSEIDNQYTDNRCNVVMFANNSSGIDMQQIPDPNWNDMYMGICTDTSACDRVQDYSKYLWFHFNM